MPQTLSQYNKKENQINVMSPQLTENFVRTLGPSEQYFWLSDQNSSKHFVLAAQVIGNTTMESWKEALAAVQRRHPLLRVCIDTDLDGRPYFRELTDASIPFRVMRDDAGQEWEREMEDELKTSFTAKNELLVRAALLHQKDRATFLLTTHHSIGDGASGAFVIRDVLEALSGKTLQSLALVPSQEDFSNLTANQRNIPSLEITPERGPTRDAAVMLTRRRSGPRVCGLRFSVDLTSRLRECARVEGATVHGALVAALVLAGREVSAVWKKDSVRVVSPVNNRKILGLDEQCTLAIVFPTGTYAPTSASEFWDVARAVKRDLSESRTPEGLATALNGFRQLMAASPDIAQIAAVELQICACETMLSNLGVLPYGTTFGELTLEALWGPSVMVGIEGEQMIGVTTLHGAIHLLQSSYTPIPNLLEGIERVITGALFRDLSTF